MVRLSQCRLHLRHPQHVSKYRCAEPQSGCHRCYGNHQFARRLGPTFGIGEFPGARFSVGAVKREGGPKA